MKTPFAFGFAFAAIAALTLAAAGTAVAGGDHKPLHGGIVTPTKLMDYELVVKPNTIQLYLSDHGKAADVSKASGKLTLNQCADVLARQMSSSGVPLIVMISKEPSS